MVKVQTERWRASTGYTDILVQSWWESPSRYFSKDTINGMEDYFEYAVGTVSGYGLYDYSGKKNLGVSLWGVDYDELNLITPVELTQEADLYPFVGKKIIISSYTAEKYGLHAGDILPLVINGIRQKMFICGIARTKGPFIGDGESVSGVVPPDIICSLYNVRGKIDNLYIKLKNPANKQKLMEVLSKRYPKYNVREPFSEKEIKGQNNRIQIPFMALTIILSFMSIYIINSTFKVITYERLPDFGTFRSIGAKKGTVSRMLLMESFLYGSAGGLLGCLLGVGVLYVTSILTMPSWEGGYQADISFQPVQLVITFILSVLLCLLSSIRPILRVSRIPIKDIILNTVNGNKSGRAVRGILGMALLGFGIIGPMLITGKYSIYSNIASIVAVIASMVLIVPPVTRLTIKVLDRIYSLLFGNEGVIAIKNLRGNKGITGSISLLAIGISCILLVNTLSFSAIREQLNYYDRCTYQIYMSAKNADKAFLQAVLATEGVKDVTKVLGIGGIDLLSKEDVIGLTEGVDTDRFLEYMNLQLSGDRQQLMDMLDQGRTILIDDRLRDRCGIELGEEIDLRAWGKVSTYKVIGFFKSITNNGNYAIISDKYMKLDMGWSDDFYSTLYIKTDQDPDKVAENLMSRFAKQQPYIKTVETLKKESLQYNRQIYMILQGFTVMTMLAGILGVFNNLIINFIRRKRSLAMYRSVGMSKIQIIKMTFIEAFTMGLIGSVLGVVSGVLMIISCKGLLRSIDAQMNLQYSPFQLLSCLIFGIVISILVSTAPAYKTSKLNLMEAIKYE